MSKGWLNIIYVIVVLAHEVLGNRWQQHRYARIQDDGYICIGRRPQSRGMELAGDIGR